MKRGLDLDMDITTPVSYEFDDIDSPSKRNRSTPPPTLLGPVHVNAFGQLAPSYLAPQSSSRPGIHRLLPKPSPIEIHLYGSYVKSDLETLLGSLVECVVLIFENSSSRTPEYLLTMAELQNKTLIISDEQPTIAPYMLSVQDPEAGLARECRVLDPVGGGRRAVPSVVLVKNRQVVATSMLGGRADSIVRSIKGWI